MVSGLSHLTFIVQDLNRMEEILTIILGARKVYESGNNVFSHSPERFFIIGEIWLAIMQGERSSTNTYDHVAFKIEDADYDACLSRIQALGLRSLGDRPRIPGEARSLYFYDDDGHLFELHTGTLEDRLQAYKRNVPQPPFEVL